MSQVSEDLIRKLVRELVRQELDEANSTASVGGSYNTPHAFGGSNKEGKGKGKAGYTGGHDDPTDGTGHFIADDPKLRKESVKEARTINVEPNWEGMWRFFKRMAITNPRDWKKMERTLGSDWLKIDKMAQQKGWKSESVNESDLGLTYKKGKTVKVTHKKSGKELVIIDKPNVKKEYEKIGYFAEGKVNELSMAPFSSSEAKLHINADIKDMSKYLGKASQQVIKIMMDGVKGGKYTPMDISRGIKEGPAQRTHFGEMTFIQSLWSKMREKFRRYSKDRKLS